MEKNSDAVIAQLENLTKRVAQLEEAHVQQQQRLRELEILHGVALSLSDELDADQTLDKFREFIQSHFPDTQLLLLLTEEQSDQLSVALSDFKLSKAAKDSLLGIKSALYKKIMNSEKFYYIPDSSKTHYKLQLFEKKNVRSWLFLPLVSHEEYRLGFMGLARNGAAAFDDENKAMFADVAQQLSSVLNKVFLFHRTKELSITDPLTRLYNRRYLNERLEEEIQRAKRYGKHLTALLVDIDYFKQYNDLYGHLQGDEVLKKLAFLFQDNTRHADIVARFGGEEFVVLLPEINYKNGRIAAEKLRIKIEKADFKGEAKLPTGNLTISIGYATFPRDAQDATDLLDLADQALYLSKEQGRNRVSHVGDSA